MIKKGVTRKLTAILYADVEGYSRLTGADEEGTHKTLNEHLDLVTSGIESHRGRVVHFAGDAVLADFDSVVDAITCATEVQKQLRTRNEKFPNGRKLEFRMGINLGDVIIDRNDIYGEDVNVAARLESIAEPGGIVVSGNLYQQVKNKVDYVFDDLGAHAFKNIAEPVTAYRVRIDPDDKSLSISDPIRRARWKAAGLAVAIILIVEAVALGAWYQFIREPSPAELARKTSAEAKARLALKQIPIDLKPGTVFQQCADCPEMVVLPPGRFLMGGTEGDRVRQKNEVPRHEVKISKPFAIGRFEVTFSQWDACVAAGGCNYSPQDRGWGRGNLPVIYANWTDIKEYLEWLTQLTSRKYRLPSEAEWEYAARAGTETVYFWGDDVGTDNANCLGCRKLGGDQTVPVGSFAPNAFKLYDMHGNVWEWMADCWNGSYGNAPADGSAWTAGDCDQRAVRGGAWGTEPDDLRSSRRMADKVNLRSGKLGFRVVMILP